MSSSPIWQKNGKLLHAAGQNIVQKNPASPEGGQWLDMVLSTDTPLFNNSTLNERNRMTFVMDNISSACEAGFEIVGSYGGLSTNYIGRFRISATGYIYASSGFYGAERITIEHDGQDPDFEVFHYWTTGDRLAFGIECWQRLFRCSIRAQRGRFPERVQPGVTMTIEDLGAEI